MIHIISQMADENVKKTEFFLLIADFSEFVQTKIVDMISQIKMIHIISQMVDENVKKSEFFLLIADFSEFGQTKIVDMISQING